MIKALWLATALASGVAGMASAGVVEAPGHVAGELDRIKLSPSGDRIATVIDTPKGPQLVVRTTSGGAIASFGTGPTRLRRIAWAGETHVVFEVAAQLDTDEMLAQSGREYSQLFVTDLKTGRIDAALSHEHTIAPIVAGDYGLFVRKGRWGLALGGVTLSGSGEAEKDFNFKSFALTHPWPDLYAVDLDGVRVEKIAPGREVYRGWVVGLDGAPLARVRRDIRTGVLTVYSLRSGKPLWSGPGAAETALEATDGARIMAVSPGGPLEAVDLTAPGAARSLFGGAPVRRPLRGSDDRLVGAEIQGGDGEIEDRFLDTTTQSAFDKAKALASAPKAQFVSVDDDRGRWLLAVAPGDYRLVDIATGAVEKVTPTP